MTRTIEPPRISDGIETKPNNASQMIIESTLKKLGKKLYKQRTGANRHAMLRKMPKGYCIVSRSLESQQFHIKGHPSGRIFPTTAKFIPHLLWLDTRHNPSKRYKRLLCTCTNCSDQRTDPEPPLEEERSEYIARPLAKVVIESFEWSNMFRIPLPELLQPDPKILQKSK